MATAFNDVKPFPATAARGGLGHNKGPLDETIIAEFLEGLKVRPEGNLEARLAELADKTSSIVACTTADQAGRYVDFIKMCAAAVKAVDEERERHNRPLLTAQRNLKARADALIAPVNAAGAAARRVVEAFQNEQRRIADEERRKAEQQAAAARRAAGEERQRQLDEAAAAGEQVPDVADLPPVAVDIASTPIAEPEIRGDYGAKAGTTTVWLHEIESVRKLPDAILKHPKVIEALDGVIRAQVRGGMHDIKGVRIWSEQKLAIR